MNKMQCRICNNNQNNQTYVVKEMRLGLREPHEYYSCGICGCLQIKSIPDNMNKYYPTNYYSFSATLPKDGFFKSKIIKKRDINVLKKTNNPFWRVLEKIKPTSKLLHILAQTNLKEEWKILDVGSGIGNKLIPLVNCGFNVKAIDPYLPKEIIKANGLIIERKDIFQVEEKFNLIMLNHVFEHIPNPHETLKAINNRLVPGGKCLIRIPVIPSYAWEVYKTDWVQIDAPRHFFIHSKKSMEILAKKSGFKIVDIIYDSSQLQFFGSELYKRGIPLSEGDFRMNKANRIFLMQELKYFQKKPKELNKKQQGDQAAFILEKI